MIANCSSFTSLFESPELYMMYFNFSDFTGMWNKITDFEFEIMKHTGNTWSVGCRFLNLTRTLPPCLQSNLFNKMFDVGISGFINNSRSC